MSNTTLTSQGGLVERSALKVNQTGIVATVLIAFVGGAAFMPPFLLIPLLAEAHRDDKLQVGATA